MCTICQTIKRPGFVDIIKLLKELTETEASKLCNSHAKMHKTLKG